MTRNACDFKELSESPDCQPGRKWGPSSCNHKALSSADSLNKLGRGFSPTVSILKPTLANTLILALWYPEQKTQANPPNPHTLWPTELQRWSICVVWSWKPMVICYNSWRKPIQVPFLFPSQWLWMPQSFLPTLASSTFPLKLINVWNDIISFSFKETNLPWLYIPLQLLFYFSSLLILPYVYSPLKLKLWKNCLLVLVSTLTSFPFFSSHYNQAFVPHWYT